MAIERSRSPIDVLPSELLSAIFDWCRPHSHELLSCMLCCRSWHTHAQPILYQHVVLSNSGLAKYTEQCPVPSSTDGAVQSLTARISDERSDASEDVSGGSRAARQLWNALSCLSFRIGSMSKLQSFSIYQPSMRPPPPGFRIPYATLNGIIAQLPPTCASLEIDVNAARAGDVHLCPTIRSKLPQLEYLRLRLPELCTKLCRPHDGLVYDAPRLRQCVINTNLQNPGAAISTVLCGTSGEENHAWAALTNHFSTTVDVGSKKTLKKLWILSPKRREPEVPGSYTAIVRHDVQSKASVALPVRNIGGLGRDVWIVRLPGLEARDMLCSALGINPVVEDYIWQETVDGVRLPQEIMRAFGLVQVPPALTADAFRAQNKLSCMLWRNEEVVGVKLLNATEGGVLEEPFVIETTPEGWKREEYGGAMLIKDT